MPVREKGNTPDVTVRILTAACTQYIPAYDLGGEEYYNREARRK
jgi:hypothetical protein